MKNFIKVVSVLFLLVFQQTAYAQMLVDYSNGTTLFDDSYSAYQGTASTSTNINVNFFGNPLTSIYVGIGGNINLVSDPSGFNVAMPDGGDVSRISPLWDDLVINAGDGAKIVENVDPNGSYYAVSWVNMETYPNTGGRQTFQAVLFGTPTTIQGFNFLPDDIAFSYQSVNAPFADAGNPGATVGLDSGDGTNFMALPGTTNGLITNNSLLPTAPNAFVLFRANGSGSYTASVQQLNAAPEPSSFVVIGVGLSLLAGTLLIARKRARKSAT